MKRRNLLLVAAAMALLVFGSTSARTAQKSDAVRVVPNGRSAAGTPGRKGATYFALERQATRVTTEFLDGNTAIAERSLDGDIVTNLRSAAGLDINRVRVNRKGGGADDAVQYIRPGADAIQAVLDPSAQPTLDWSNRQSYRFYQDNVTSAANLRWRDGSIRGNGGAATEDDEAETVKAIETEWANGLSAKTRRVRLKPGDQFDGKAVTGDVLVTTVQLRGANVGVANYFVNERIYAWKMPGVTEGLIANSHLLPRYGGWLFKPDMVWMNLQALAFYEWRRSAPATRAAAPAAKPGLLARLVNLVAPPVYANDEGCDGLHWLDGTVYRFCCDIHDLCYEKYGCSSSSWWQVWTSWRCDRCNAEAVWCFAGGGTGHGPYYI
ncbi:MAG: hypothetical protein EPO35_12745 [Acidobacteria bacterium]|nr:MAG: hypothetical protein EPO35_12745 [Acidobacteriota bacterium]